MNPPTDFSQVLALLIAQFAPYLISGPILSHALAQFKFMDEKATPDWIKIGVAALVALAGVFLNNLVSGQYSGGAQFGAYLSTTVQQASLLFGTMTLTNVSMDNFLPSLGDWFVKLVATIRGAKQLAPAIGQAG